MDALITQATQAYQEQRYLEAAQLFGQAADQLAQAGDALQAAEMRNNQSVALLQAGKANQALEAAQPTVEVFTQAADWRRAGLAWGNVAAALEALERLDEALQAYQQSAQLLEKAGEKDMQATVLEAIAAIQLRQGQLTDSAFSMLHQMSVDPSLPWWKRWINKFIRWLLR